MSGFSLIGLFTVFLLSGCSSTKLSQTWSDPNNKSTYEDIMIVSIADSEMTRRAYEAYFVDSLREKGITALSSYTLLIIDDLISRKLIQ